MYELALFAGGGGGLLATQYLLGWRTVCYVEIEEYRVELIKQRIKDGLLDDAPIWLDVRTFGRGNPECGAFIERLARLDDLVITAGFPCQPFSSAGKELGDEDPRNMWVDTLRIIGEIRPTWIFLENSANLLQFSARYRRPAYVERIVAELAALGYVGRWGCLSASTVGAAHKRERAWFVAHTGCQGREIVLRDFSRVRPYADRRGRGKASDSLDAVFGTIARLEKRLGESSVFGTNDGLADQVDRLATVGEGQHPLVAATAWKLLGGR